MRAKSSKQRCPALCFFGFLVAKWVILAGEPGGADIFRPFSVRPEGLPTSAPPPQKKSTTMPVIQQIFDSAAKIVLVGTLTADNYFLGQFPRLLLHYANITCRADCMGTI